MNRWQLLAVRCEGPAPTTLPALNGPHLLILPATADGEALAGAIAAASGASMVGRIAAVTRDGGDLLVSRASHGGRMAVRLRLSGEGLAVAVATDIPECDGSIALGRPSNLALGHVDLPDQRVSLESARIVIGGGRGLGPQDFDRLADIAEALDAAVAASLPAVDLGLAPVARQVGQSGKFVTPDIYLAVGLSGTPQHLAGIGSATRIIAVNSDRDAAIFRFAEAGAVADAGILLPLLSAALKAAGKTLTALAPQE